MGSFHRSAKIFSTRPLNTIGSGLPVIFWLYFTRWWNDNTRFVTPVSAEGAQELPNFLKNNWPKIIVDRGKRGSPPSNTHTHTNTPKPGAKHWWMPISEFWAEVNKNWANSGSIFVKIKNIAIWWDATQPQHCGFQIRVSPLVLSTADGGHRACYHQLSAFPTGRPNTSFKALFLQNC